MIVPVCLILESHKRFERGVSSFGWLVACGDLRSYEFLESERAGDKMRKHVAPIG